MLRSLARIALVFFVTVTALAAEAGWTPWVSLGGTLTSDPGACTVGNYTYVVVRGTDSRYYYRRRYLPTGIWDGWKMVTASFQFSGAPGVACLTLNSRPTLMVSGITGNGQFYVAYVNDGPWGGWGNFRNGNQPGTGPSISLMSPFSGHYFLRNPNNTLSWRVDGGGDWVQIGGYVSADPGSTLQSPGHLDLVVRARDGSLRHAFWEGGLWYGASPVGGGAVLSGAEIVSRYQGSLDLFARGQGNVMLHKRWSNGIWGPWINLGGSITSGPGATVYASKQRMMVFARWSNGQLYYRAWAP